MYMSDESLVFPADIDEPKMIMFWEVIHFIIGISLIPVGFLLKDVLILSLATVFSIFILRYFKRQLGVSKRNFLAHSAYSVGIASDDILKKYPSSYKNFAGQ
mgnify:CR=1 FL=1